MNVSITPHKKGDGGILALPLQSNIQKGRKDWHLRDCPVCGAKCWESDLARKALKEEPELRAACTMCALKAELGISKK